MAGDWSPLRSAVRSPDEKIVFHLLQSGAKISKRADGSTELHDAVQFGHLRITSMLLHYGFDPNVKRSDGWTPLLLAKGGGPVDIVRSFERHCNKRLEYEPYSPA
jgi:ankyrin repeat protein